MLDGFGAGLKVGGEDAEKHLYRGLEAIVLAVDRKISRINGQGKNALGHVRIQNFEAKFPPLGYGTEDEGLAFASKLSGIAIAHRVEGQLLIVREKEDFGGRSFLQRLCFRKDDQDRIGQVKAGEIEEIRARKECLGYRGVLARCFELARKYDGGGMGRELGGDSGPALLEKLRAQTI